MDQLYLVSVASTISGIMGKMLCYPLDTVKVQLYMERSKIRALNFDDIKNAFKSTYKTGGIKQFYKGGLIAIVFQSIDVKLGSGPAFAVYITSYEYFKQNLQVKSKVLLHLTCGLLAEVVSGILWLPIDVVKERMQVQQKLKCYNYSGSIHAIYQIVSQEGLKGLYRGFGATLGFFGPYSAIYFMCLEKMKEITEYQQNPFVRTAVSSSTAFLIASLITQPLSVSKIRIQVQARKGIHEFTQESTFNYRHQLHAIFRIFKDEGFQALFRGLSMRILYAGTLTTFNMSSTELIRNKLRN